MGMFCNGKVQFTSIYANLAKLILRHLAEHPAQMVDYEVLANELTINSRSFGKYLDELSIKCHELGLPLISAVVAQTGGAYEGFYECAASLGYSTGEADTQRTLVFKQDWSRLKACMRINDRLSETLQPSSDELHRQ